MCGRYALPDDHLSMLHAFDIATDLRRDVKWVTLMPRYNVAPTDQVPVVLRQERERHVEPMRWGFMPFHTTRMRGRMALNSEDKSINTPINARAETVHSHGFFQTSFERRRCIIPAGGFYEWKRTDGARVPYWIYLRDRSWMAFAGVYTWWKSPDASWVPSCVIITTSPNSFMKPIHDRMPVILTEDAYDLWLDPGNRDIAELKELLLPYPAGEMRGHQVMPLVNKVANEGSELINLVN